MIFWIPIPWRDFGIRTTLGLQPIDVAAKPVQPLVEPNLLGGYFTAQLGDQVFVKTPQLVFRHRFKIGSEHLQPDCLLSRIELAKLKVFSVCSIDKEGLLPPTMKAVCSDSRSAEASRCKRETRDHDAVDGIAARFSGSCSLEFSTKTPGRLLPHAWVARKNGFSLSKISDAWFLISHVRAS